MLQRHYNARDILNAGEAMVDGMLSDLIYSEMNWHALSSLLLTRNRSHKTGRGEVDFILVCEYGVLVVEVKGGIITYRDGRLYQRDIKKDEEKNIDPFGQIRSNCQTIKDVLNNALPFDVFVGEAVIFPESDFRYNGDAFQHFWHQNASPSINNFLENTIKRQSVPFGFEKLKSKEILHIVKKLIPEVNWQKRPEQMRHAKQDTERRSRHNYKILKGLEGNPRLMIEGPPGSGKSTFAQQFILDKVAKEDARVLYLCWNEFLAVHTQQFFIEMGVAEKVSAVCFFDYVNMLWTKHPVEPKQLTFADVPQLYSRLQTILTDLQSVSLLDTYDLIVVDEAQDLFDKGIDLILDKQLHDGKDGLNRGDYIVFYDSLQAFDKGTDTIMYQLVYHTIREASAHYRLLEQFRTIEGSGIASFLDDAMQGSIDFERTYGGDMVIKTYNSVEDCILMIKTAIRTAKEVERVKEEHMVVLFSSNLVSGNVSSQGSKPLDGALQQDEAFEKIEKGNLTTPSEKIRYTSVLKYKGLEKDLVILVINDLFNEKIKTFYQMYIGASRAKAKVVLLIDDESARKAKKQTSTMESILIKEKLTL